MGELTIVQRIVSAIRDVVGERAVSLHEPCFAGNEWQYLKECLDSNFVSSVGKFVDRFEHELADYTGAKHAVAVVNGTAALHVALQLAGVQRDDEVLVPALTFVATSNAVTYCGALPHFVESEERTLGIDVQALRNYLVDIGERRGEHFVNRATGRIIRAMAPMHVFGHASDIDGLLAIAADFHIALVEDAAESLGTSYLGKHTGTFGLLGTLSFNGNKTITTGGGGAILTDNAALARRAKHITTTAKIPHRWEYRHDEIGYNYRLPNLNAALGCAQLEQLPILLEAKRRLHDCYAAALKSVPDVRLMSEPHGSQSNYWLQTLILDESIAGLRDAILTGTNDAGYMTRPAWTLNHRLTAFEGCPRMSLTMAESLERRIINVPSSAQLAPRSMQ